MKLEEKYKTFEEQMAEETMPLRHGTPLQKWTLKRRLFTLSGLLGVFFLTVLYQHSSPNLVFSVDDTSICSNDDMQQQQQKLYTVLHTGFPPTSKSKLTGMDIEPEKAAAIAFSPDPAATKRKKSGFDFKQKTSKSCSKRTVDDNNNESWWDRMFPQHHVHLSFLQIPVRRSPQALSSKACSCFFSYERQQMNRTVEALLSICESKKEHFWSKRQIPNLDQCVETVKVRTSPEEDNGNEEDGVDYLFGVLEWAPKREDAPVLLKKSKLYWLVVRTTDEFEWVNVDERGRKEQGFNEGPYDIVYQSELGWEYKFNDEPIPSAFIRVEEH